MAITLNEKSMMEELKSLLQEDEKYVSVSWATLSNRTPKLSEFMQEGELNKIGSSNIYSYVGVTKTSLNIVTLNPLDVTRVTGRFKIPLHGIQNISIKNNLLRCSITFFFGKENITINWLKGAGGTGIKNQRNYVQRFVDFLNKQYTI